MIPKPQGAAVLSPLGLGDPPPQLSSAGSGRVRPISSREELSHRPPPFRRPYHEYPVNRSFVVFFFDFLFGPLLNASFSVMKPKTCPNWTPTDPKSSPKRSPNRCYVAKAPHWNFANTPTLLLVFDVPDASKIVQKSSPNRVPS